MLSKEMKSDTNRLFCVDLLRGLDIFFLLVVSYTLLHGGFFQVWPIKTEFGRIVWDHALSAFAAPGKTPTGFGLQDFTQPLFIFVTGVSASLAVRKFVSPDGFRLAAFWKNLLKRTLMLWALGSLIRGVLTFKLFTGGQPSFCLYSDTLHTIAVAYFAASAALLLKSVRARVVLALSLIAATAAVMAVYGDYSRFGNAARLIEEAVYSRLGGKSKDFCYLLTTFTWAGMGILASLAGDVLKSSLSNRNKAALLFLAGAGSFASGWILSFWIPPIRFIYTASFAFETLGLSAVLLSALFVLCDVLRLRRGTWILILFGQCSLAAWMIVNFFGAALQAVALKFVGGFPALFGTDRYQPIVIAVARAVILVFAVWLWRDRFQKRKRSH